MAPLPPPLEDIAPALRALDIEPGEYELWNSDLSDITDLEPDNSNLGPPTHVKQPIETVKQPVETEDGKCMGVKPPRNRGKPRNNKSHTRTKDSQTVHSQERAAKLQEQERRVEELEKAQNQLKLLSPHGNVPVRGQGSTYPQCEAQHGNPCQTRFLRFPFINITSIVAQLLARSWWPMFQTAAQPIYNILIKSVPEVPMPQRVYYGQLYDFCCKPPRPSICQLHAQMWSQTNGPARRLTLATPGFTTSLALNLVILHNKCGVYYLATPTMTPLDSNVELAPMRPNPDYQMPYKPTFAKPTEHLALARACIHVMHFPSFWAGMCMECQRRPLSCWTFKLKHSTTKHLEFKSTGAAIEPELDQLLKTKPLLSRENIEDVMQCLPPLIEKISKLRSFDGWACTLDDCPYISRDADKTKHCNKVHNSKFYQGIQWTEPCKIQSLCPDGKKHIFRVHPILDAVKLGNSFLKFLQLTQDNPIFEAHLWPVRVQGYSLPHLTSLV
ncbi:hypothetical protein FB451DRAFT_1187983 [Mycena latifolia]|nr:hypothetical protein FB451DRAFT_1187983 [Mycena latifolia]